MPGEAQGQYTLVLESGGVVAVERQNGEVDAMEVVARGRWEQDGEGVLITFTELLGEPASKPDVIKFEYVDGFPTETQYRVGGELLDLDAAAFSLGSGDRHPLITELHLRLAAIDYLGFTVPADDVYGESTRLAVVLFQERQGWVPSGLVDARTWLRLGNPRPPLPLPTPVATPPPPLGVAPGVPHVDDLPTHTADGHPIAYLTFDDGPHPTYTGRILGLLARYDALATFFVLGQSVLTFPDEVRATAAAGHYVANHTFGHHTLEGLTAEAFLEEVESARAAILDVALDLFSLDRDVRYLRPPYGATDLNTRNYAASLGFAVVLWDIDPQDWRRPGSEAIASHVVDSIRPGAIVLMHDGGGERSQTIAALEVVLESLSSQGYVFRHVFVP